MFCKKCNLLMVNIKNLLVFILLLVATFAFSTKSQLVFVENLGSIALYDNNHLIVNQYGSSEKEICSWLHIAPDGTKKSYDITHWKKQFKEVVAGQATLPDKNGNFYVKPKESYIGKLKNTLFLCKDGKVEFIDLDPIEKHFLASKYVEVLCYKDGQSTFVVKKKTRYLNLDCYDIYNTSYPNVIKIDSLLY